MKNLSNVQELGITPYFRLLLLLFLNQACSSICVGGADSFLNSQLQWMHTCTFLLTTPPPAAHIHSCSHMSMKMPSLYMFPIFGNTCTYSHPHPLLYTYSRVYPCEYEFKKNLLVYFPISCNMCTQILASTPLVHTVPHTHMYRYEYEYEYAQIYFLPFSKQR